jgi:hypothetical protein
MSWTAQRADPYQDSMLAFHKLSGSQHHVVALSLAQEKTLAEQ